jgi:hypothetical protein
MDRRAFIKGGLVVGAAAATTRVGGWFDAAQAAGGLVCRTGPVAPTKLPTITSDQDGPWGSPSTWKQNRVPAASDVVEIKHSVRLDVSTTVSGVLVQPAGLLRFTADETDTLSSKGNVVVLGELKMQPESASVVHTLTFVGVDESKFVGGGDVVLDSDVGLWVMGAGKLTLDGTPRKSWNRTGNDPTWLASDELVVTPIGYGDGVHDESQFKSFTRGSKVPTVKMSDGTTFTAEVLNLTRNVRVQGTPGGRAHVFIMSSAAQTVRYAALRYLGPRQKEGDGTEFVLGRYGLHFHKCDNANEDVTIESVLVRDTGSHAFVPHMSHGMTFHGCISYNTFEDAYWWDPPEVPYPSPFKVKTNRPTYEGCVAALVRSDPDYQGFRMAGFLLGQGDPNTNTCKGCVAVGVQGNVDSAGFVWPELPNGSAVWNFDGNVAHNNSTAGATVWQVNHEDHEVTDFTAYHNGKTGVYNGAYGNPYHWSDLSLYGNGGGTEDPLEETQFFMWAGSLNVGAVKSGTPWTLEDSRIFAEGRSPTAIILAGKCPITLKNEDGSEAKPGEVRGNVVRGYTEEAVRFTFEYHDFGPYETQWHLSGNDLGNGKWFWVHNSTLASSTLAVDGVGTLHPTSFGSGQLHPEWNAKVT